MKNPCLMSACEAAAAIADKKISSVEMVKACLDRIDAREPAAVSYTHLRAHET